MTQQKSQIKSYVIKKFRKAFLLLKTQFLSYRRPYYSQFGEDDFFHGATIDPTRAEDLKQSGDLKKEMDVSNSAIYT